MFSVNIGHERSSSCVERDKMIFPPFLFLFPSLDRSRISVLPKVCSSRTLEELIHARA